MVFGGFVKWLLGRCIWWVWVGVCKIACLSLGDVYYFMDWLTLFWVLDLILVVIHDTFVY